MHVRLLVVGVGQSGVELRVGDGARHVADDGVLDFLCGFLLVLGRRLPPNLVLLVLPFPLSPGLVGLLHARHDLTVEVDDERLA